MGGGKAIASGARGCTTSVCLIHTVISAIPTGAIFRDSVLFKVTSGRDSMAEMACRAATTPVTAATDLGGLPNIRRTITMVGSRQRQLYGGDAISFLRGASLDGGGS